MTSLVTEPNKHGDRYLRFLAALLILVGIVLLPPVLQLVVNAADAGPQNVIQPDVKVGPPLNPDGPAVALAAQEIVRAESVLHKSPTVRRLLGSSGFTISEVGPWQATDGTLLGLGAVIELKTPITRLNSTWPTLQSNRTSEDSPPSRVWVSDATIPKLIEGSRFQIFLRTGQDEVAVLQPLDGTVEGPAELNSTPRETIQ